MSFGATVLVSAMAQEPSWRPKEHAFGKGKIVWGPTPEETLAKMGVQPDFTAGPFVRWIHRSTDGTEIYFVACASQQPTETLCTFRAEGNSPSSGSPRRDGSNRPPCTSRVKGVTRIPIHFEPGGSVFVVFRQSRRIVRPRREHNARRPADSAGPGTQGKVVIEKAIYGVLSDPNRTRDVSAKLQAVVDGGELSFQVARMAQGDDPAYRHRQDADRRVHRRRQALQGQRPGPGRDHPRHICRASEQVIAGSSEDQTAGCGSKAWQPGGYEFKTASGRTLHSEVPALPQPLEIAGPWQLRFPPNAGAPEQVTLERLVSWSEHSSPGVKYFSGTATYTKTIAVPPQMLGENRHLVLDLGNVQVMAQVKLNGKDLGILWKSPYRVEVTDAVKAGGQCVGSASHQSLGEPHDWRRDPARG